MKILIFNKREFNNYMKFNDITDDNVETKDVMFISINNYYEGSKSSYSLDVKSHFKRQHSNVMIMHFGDYSEEYVYRTIHEGPTGLFNEYKAKKLYQFIKKNKDKSMVVIHCGAGISRSGAVGTFIQDTYGTVSYEDFKRKNARIQPNNHILKLLQKELKKDKSK